MNSNRGSRRSNSNNNSNQQVDRPEEPLEASGGIDSSLAAAERSIRETGTSGRSSGDRLQVNEREQAAANQQENYLDFIPAADRPLQAPQPLFYTGAAAATRPTVHGAIVRSIVDRERAGEEFRVIQRGEDSIEIWSRNQQQQQESVQIFRRNNQGLYISHRQQPVIALESTDEEDPQQEQEQER